MEPDDVLLPSPFTIDPGATNPELAQKFLAQHRGDMQQRSGEVEQALGGMQLTSDNMAKLLDETTAAIKASRSGRMNTALLAMGAGMLSSRGNFAEQLGAGLGAMVPAINKEREQEDATHMNLANLAFKKAQAQNMPLEAKLAYMRALQTGDQAAIRAIEQALIRSQGSGNKQAGEEQKLIAKTVQNALEEARKQVDNMGKEMYATAEEREAEIKRRFLENIKIMRASGVKIPDEVINPIIQTGGGNGVPGAPTGMGTRKSYFDIPQGEERNRRTLDAGLPTEPTGYIYDAVGPKERPDILKKNIEAWNKETKDWGETSENMRGMTDKLDRIDALLTKNPKLTGPMLGGTVRNSWLKNYGTDRQTLEGLFNSIQLHSVPKGQGAVSNLERELFASASPNMDFTADANKNLIGIQREVIKRDKDRREFFSQYFNNYRTTDGMVEAWDRYINSPAGSAFIRDKSGNPVANTNRQSWREFFRTERGAKGFRKGGYVRLGAEYD